VTTASSIPLFIASDRTPSGRYYPLWKSCDEAWKT
jgi:hypothetical protein